METDVQGDLLLSDEIGSSNSESLEETYSELRYRFEAIAYSLIGNKEDGYIRISRRIPIDAQCH
jgi:hypothetical protein